MKNKYDVIVVGGGLSGVASAIAASRQGCSVLLIERYGFLGGMATAGLVNPVMPYWIKLGQGSNYDQEKPMNRGIFEEILKELGVLGGLHINQQTFNEEILKLVLDRMIQKNNISVLLHSYVTQVIGDSDYLTGVVVSNKSGNTVYQANYFVDGSGDADLSAMSGCEYKIGEEGTGVCQPMTLCFRLSNVDDDNYTPVHGWEHGGYIADSEECKNEINDKYTKEKDKGHLQCPREDVLTFPHLSKGVIHFNTTRVLKKSAVNAEELTMAEIEAREQVFEIYNFLRNNFQYFENSQLLMTGTQIGVRESRRIVGEKTITQEDILGVTKFEDSIARGTYSIDIHSGTGGSTKIMEIPYGDYYTIPYGALIPKGKKNIIVAGRPISSTHEAHSAYRVMPIATSIGEAAGIASAVALQTGTSYKDADIHLIQNILSKSNALY